MTSLADMADVLSLVADLSRDLPDQERYQRVLDCITQRFPCHACALLRLEQDTLVPVAVYGLSEDTLGRRFSLAHHPRLQAIAAQRGPLRFAADCELPDPYDGLVEIPQENAQTPLDVHDCMGCALYLDDRLWGVLTLDALQPGHFDGFDLTELEIMMQLAAASVAAAERMHALSQRAAHSEQVSQAMLQSRAGQDMIGSSAVMRALQDEIALVASSSLAVLILGETGVGKERVAEALHRQSDRARQPLISLNCAALNETLAESELFGHARGAFSGAVTERAGKFELADGGTLFLDEVGELPLSIQAKLLRVLQSGQIQRLGSDKDHRVDVRIIAATNRQLQEEVRAGRFRADLYHRLSVYPLQVPPLRERGRDVLQLAGYFLEQNRIRLGVAALRLSHEAQQALLGYRWPGNVRELEHALSRAALKALSVHAGDCRTIEICRTQLDLADAPLMTVSNDKAAEPLPGAVFEEPGWQGLDLRQATEQYQAQMIQAILVEQQGNWSAAARILGVDRANLHRLARRLGMKA
ncbi:transcriptional regulator [Pokkaliibacter plantistimulans]|uniref:Transcriptional regulator n=1 Tax=Pokkaliibacter plantistimulans TaxID=1635171 RepID=A0ABX5LSU2_9GAMM|nr:nitric oxide reductase transcriptional regulator NorR [Pokkaliibacter plantistimulans]PXF29719.1 transcriptional regulator [Pokkaliibacter plantistimulans]